MEWESCKNYFCINQYRAAELFRHSLEMNHSYSYNYDYNYNYDSFHVHFLLCICILFNPSRHMDVPSVSISVTRIKVKVGETFLTRPTWSDLCQFGERYFEAGHPHFHSVDSTLLVWDFTSTSHHEDISEATGHWVPPGGRRGTAGRISRVVAPAGKTEAAPRISSIHSTGLLRNIGGKVSSLCFRI